MVWYFVRYICLPIFDFQRLELGKKCSRWVVLEVTLVFIFGPNLKTRILASAQAQTEQLHIMYLWEANDTHIHQSFNICLILNRNLTPPSLH